MQQKGIGVSNLPNLKYKNICRKGLDLNLLLVGSHGLGKTTFVNGLTNTEIINTCEIHSQFQIWTFTVVENDFKTNVRITEVDCIGDMENNENCWVPTVNYINECYNDFYNNEQQNVRDYIKDKRIHVCLYFLEPNINFIRQADLITMKEISKLCNLIPIVSKSDLLNEKQIQTCFDFLRNEFSNHGINLFEDRNNSIGDIESFVPPFFVINPDKHLSPTRKYSFSTQILGKNITNDLYRLREHLTRKNMLNLMETTEEYYDKYRAASLYSYISAKANANLNKDLLSCSLMKDLEVEENKLKELKARIAEKKKLLNK